MLMFLGEIHNYDMRLPVLQPQNTSCDRDTAVQKLAVVVLHDSVGVQSGILGVDGDHQA